MLTEQEAQTLMSKLVELRQKAKLSNEASIVTELKKHEQVCMSKFKYLVTMRTSRYRKFGNYDDLNQEGFLALLKAMKNYNPNKGSFFWWAHKYIDTKISRSANLHTTIRFPLNFAKQNIPHKESIMPMLIEEVNCPDKNFEKSQCMNIIQSALFSLNENQKEIINLAYGIDGNKPISISKICKRFNISRLHCIKIIGSAISTMKEYIKL
jgi:RNA polymerase sigma factor (sigma-70 family)